MSSKVPNIIIILYSSLVGKTGKIFPLDILLKLFPSLTERKEDRKKKKSEKEKAMG